MIILMTTIMVVFESSLNAFSDEIVIDNKEKVSIERALIEAEECIEHVDSINDLLKEHPSLLDVIYREDALDYLCNIRDESRQNEDGSLLNILINYIASGYKTTSIEVLRSYVTIYITTLSGKTIIGRRHSNEPDLQCYNCHSYAWYYGCSYNSNDKLWLQEPYAYYSTSYGTCYTRVFSSTVYPSTVDASQLLAGDIVLYRCYDDEIYENPGIFDNVLHSATVTSINGNTINCVSKMGTGPVTYHTISNSGFEIAFDGSHAGQEREIVVYRRNHSIDSSWLANQNYRAKNSSKHYVACAYCARGTVSEENHTLVTVGSVTRCSLCGYRVEVQNLGQ